MRVPLEDRFWAHVDKSNNCWLWTGCRCPKGYGHLKGRAEKTVKAHRVSFEMHFGAIPCGLFVCHHCDHPACVRPDHLFLGTVLDNAIDAKRKGRYKPIPPRGRVLTKAELAEIARLYLSGQESLRSLARRFGVTHPTLSLKMRGIPQPNRRKTHLRVATHLVGVSVPPQEERES